MITNSNKKWYYEFSYTNKENNKENKYTILRPNRRIREDGELFFASETSRFAKAGVLPKAAWNTILSNGGGTISDTDREEYGKLLLTYRDLSFELQSILIKSEGNRTEEENKRVAEVLVEIENVKKKIQSFEAEQINIFENTAEAKARNRTILWWVLNLSYTQTEDNKFEPLFAGESFQEKLDSYDFIEEQQSNEGDLAIIRRLTYLITLWFLGRIDSTEDFEAFDKDFIKTSSEQKLPEDSNNMQQKNTDTEVAASKDDNATETTSDTIVTNMNEQFVV